MAVLTPYLTLGQIATKYGCQLWQVRRLFERELVPETPRVGRSRVIHVDDLPAIERALREHGYIGDDRPEGDACA